MNKIFEMLCASHEKCHVDEGRSLRRRWRPIKKLSQAVELADGSFASSTSTASRLDEEWRNAKRIVS